MKISFACPDVSKRDVDRIMSVLASGRFSPGPLCREFEKKFAGLYGVPFAVFVNSGTDALRLSLLAMKEKYRWKDGAKVIAPALTFPATVNVILQAGLEPFFADVGMHDWNLNPENAGWRLGHTGSEIKSSGVVCVLPAHLFGQQAPMKEIMDLAGEYGWRVLEDSCETVGAGPLWGSVACFSTYQCHILATGVGGVAVTKDGDLHEIIRSMANHGRDAFYLPGYRTPPVSKELLGRRFRFVRDGYSCRATEFEAALGLGQIERLETNLASRRNMARLLSEALSGFPVQIPSALRAHSYMMFPVVLDEGTRAGKYDLCLALEKSGVETRDMMPITTQPHFKKFFVNSSFPVAERVNERGFYLPCHPGMTPEDVSGIRRVFSRVLDKS